jgi:methionyl-tRNA formyltransferase
MHIVLLCATQRGYRFLDKLSQLTSEHRLTVFSFPETGWEPLYLDAIRQLTEERGGVFIQAQQVGATFLEQFWETAEVDLMLVVSWRYLIPKRVYQKARLGAFVFHDSLLPAYRGFSPTVWAIINGEDHTGVTLFEMAEEVDSGDIVDQEWVPIGEEETIAQVMERVTETYLTVLERNYPALIAGTAPRTPQNHAEASYTCKRIPSDNWINWKRPAHKIYNLIRATTHPYTGAFTLFEKKRLYIWEAQLLSDERHYVGSIPGRVVEILPRKGVVVLTGEGQLMLTKVQLLENEVLGEIVTADKILDSLGMTLGY